MAFDIRNVKSITDLISYFSQNLGWDIDIDSFDDIEDISYDFDAEDIGLKEENFAKISSLRQLQPLVDDQQWGIFCIEFDSNKFEVSALRKILSKFVPKRRSMVDHAVWEQQDLLFICNWGEDNNRTIGIAHFEDQEKGLPQIKMISCAPALEDFTQIKVFEERLAQLAWPKNTSNIEAWREAWSNAFASGYRQTIQDSSTLTIQLAAEAQNIRNRILSILDVETQNGYVHLLYDKFKDTLIHDMTEQQFADMYAQTVVYGLFSARCMDSTQDDFSAAEAIDCIPSTNPFLKSLMRECLGSQGSNKLSFDELEIGNVVDLLLHTKTDEIIKDFNRQTGGGREDPVIHFYEEFLTAYDKSQKVQRGVYYTPQPVVNFIVRAVDSILKTEFGYEDGLASTDTKKIKVMRDSLRRVNGYKTQIEEQIEVPAVQILDPATGTGTFLRQTILQIYENFQQKHKGKPKSVVASLWNKYVDESLLPRLNGFELMMAPYAVAHMKLAMVLKDTGYDFSGEHRLNVFLTNSLEEAGSSDDQLTLFSDPLAIESVQANKVKKNHGVNILIGNPPYSVSSSNRGDWIMNLLLAYKKDLNEKKLNLDDDYIKFIRYAQYVVDNANAGILAYISNNSFLDGVTHRQMRTELMQSFDSIYIIDLHGSSKRHEVAPDGGKDENVFDIQQGVSINIFVKTGKKVGCTIYHCDLYGTREYKYSVLTQKPFSLIDWVKLSPSSPYYFFAPKDFSTKDEYEKGFLITDLFVTNNSGIKTDRDSLFIDMDATRQSEKARVLLSGHIPTEFVAEYRVEDSSSYKLTEKIKGKEYNDKYIKSIIYRPFDYQWIYYDPSIISRPGYGTMSHMLYPNWGLYVKRGFEDSDAAPVFCCDRLISMRAWSRPGSIGSEYLFPLYIYSDEFGKLVKRPNFNVSVAKKIANSMGCSFQADSEELSNGEISPLMILDYIYGALHNPEYVDKFREFIKIEFPRIPYPEDYDTFSRLGAYGERLRKLHCMETSEPSNDVVYHGQPNPVVEKVSWKDNSVYISKSSYFDGVSKHLWDYYIGGYQPLQKWLKDRKGIQLSDADLSHFREMVFIINNTDAIIAEMRNRRNR